MIGTQGTQDLFASQALMVPTFTSAGSYTEPAWFPPTAAEGSVPISQLQSFIALRAGEHVRFTLQDRDENLGIEVSEIGLSLTPPLVKLNFLPDDGIVNLVATIDGVANLSATLAGDLVADGSEFSPKEVTLKVVPLSHIARADFVASSLIASLALGGRVSLRIVGEEIKFRGFQLPLGQIANQIRTRETARRLMIIGKATGTEFGFPARLSGKEIQEIAFTHHAVVDREFIWPMSQHGLPLRADYETLQKLDSTTGPHQIGIPRQVVFDLLGREIRLGTAIVIMQEAVIEDLPQVRQRVALLDGELINASVRSLVGRALIRCPDAPGLPSQPWTPDEEALMALEPELCRRLADRYNSLAAETLSGLSDSEKEQLTRPKPRLNSLLERRP